MSNDGLTFKQVLAFIGVISIAAIVVVNAALYAIDASAKVECLKLQDDASKYPARFFISPVQKTQCDYFKIDINAPVATSTAN